MAGIAKLAGLYDESENFSKVTNNVGDAVMPPGIYGSFGAAASAKILVEDLVPRIMNKCTYKCIPSDA